MRREDHDPDRLSTEEVGRVLEEMEAADWKRAERYARMAAHGLPGMEAEDLLHEACTLLLAGARRFPRAAKPVRVLKNAMRSVASNARKSGWAKRIDQNVLIEPEHSTEVGDESEDGRPLAPAAKNWITPEIEALAKEEYDAVMALFEGDAIEREILEAWACGMRGADVVQVIGLSEKDYDAARNRLRRKLAQFTAEGHKS